MLRSARGRGPPVRQLPHDVALLPHPCGAAHRSQSPFERDGEDRRDAVGVPGIRRYDPEGERFPFGDPAAEPLRHVRRREMAPHAGDRADDGRSARQMAARPRLRALLRIHGRRDRPVPARPRLRQPPRRSTAHPGGGLPPDGGSRGSRHHFSSRICVRRTRRSRSSSTSRRARATRRTKRRRRTSTPTAAVSTQAGTGGATRSSRGRRHQDFCRREPNCPCGRRGSRRGTICRATSAGCTRG